MTMRPWLARALRRALLTAVMMIGGLGALHRLLHAAPELPPRDVDRVVVWGVEGAPREITDPATVRRIVVLVRSVDGPSVWMRGQLHAWETPTALFYRGDRLLSSALLGPRTLILPARSDQALLRMRASEAAELHRLLGTERHEWDR